MTNSIQDSVDEDRNPTVANVLSTYLRAVKLLWNASPSITLTTLLVMTVNGVVPVIVIYMTKVIVDSVLVIVQDGGSWQLVFVPLLLLFGLWCFETISSLTAPLLDYVLQQKTDTIVAEEVLMKVSRIDLAYFDSPELHDRMHRASRRYGHISGMAILLFQTMQSVITTVGALVLVSVILHPLAFVVLVIGVIPRIWVEKLIADREFTVEKSLARTERTWMYMFDILTSRLHAKEVRVYGTANFFLNKFREARQYFVSTTFRLNVKFAKWSVALGAVANLGIVLVYAFAVIEALGKRVTVGDLAALFQAARTTSEQLMVLFHSVGSIYAAGLEASHIFDFLDSDLPHVDGALIPWEGESTHAYPSSIVKGITFEDVSFRYPTSSNAVLENLSFTISAGQKVAFVGENGAGKSTIIKLACRLYDPTEGRILIDDMDMRSIEVDSIPGSIGTIFQDFSTYSLTAAENIALGDVAHIKNTGKIEEAAKQGGAFDFISRLDEGFDTFLGRQLEEGTDLSGGEWQRVAISRAAMASGSILILDEPTSALDAYQENELYQRIFNMTKDKTVIFVSHRFSTVRMADVILVLEDGKIVETGSHDELMQRNGSYMRMFSLQASRYA